MDLKPRFDHWAASPDTMNALRQLENYVRASGLEPTLLALVKTRASQKNGCAYCLEMHTREARAEGETETRLYMLSAWRESSLYSPRERAALAWTDAITLIATSHAPDDVFEEAQKHFSPAELVKLTLAIGVINTWNRFAIGFRAQHRAPNPA